MDICEEIDKAKICAANMTYDYAMLATFGNNSDENLYRLLQLNSYIHTLERNVPTKRYVREKISLMGHKVCLSSLKRRNNNLILENIEQYTCSIVEDRKCLSDEEICKIVENLHILCNNSNCN